MRASERAFARPWSKFPFSPGLCGQFFQKSHDRFDTTVEIRDVEFLIRRVQVVVWKTEAHHDAWDLKMLLDDPHLLARLRSNARRLAESFSLEKSHQRFEQSMLELMSK